METNKLFVPTTLLEAVEYYAEEENAFRTLVALRWPFGPVCANCGDTNVTRISKRFAFKCNGCKKQFSAKGGSVFEDSALPLAKWLPAVWLIANAKNGISSCELARSLGITQKSAWFMLHRIRHAMATGSFEKFTGTVEVDETAIGGAERFKHLRKRNDVGGGSSGKAIVQAFLERGDKKTNKTSKVRTTMLDGVGGPTMKRGVREHVEPGSELMTDGASGYRGLSKEFVHEFVDHAVAYVRGEVHTNGLENYFSLLKRMIKGTYIAIEPYHLTRYCDELAMRFNYRKCTDGERFLIVLGMVAGKRLDYKTLTSAYEAFYQQAIPVW